MARTLALREPSTEERATLERLTHARTVAARRVVWARVVWAALQGERVEAIAARFHVTAATVYLWLHRCNEAGVAGLEDKPRQGRPPTYPAEQVSAIVATARTHPETLGLPFESWTLDRLVAVLAEQRGIAMKRSRLGEVLLAEGLRWGKEETWFGERVDPDVAEKSNCLPCQEAG
jgi:transposase